MISQIPPKHAEGPTRATRVEPVLQASDLVRRPISLSGARGTRTLDPLLANRARWGANNPDARVCAGQWPMWGHSQRTFPSIAAPNRSRTKLARGS
jgi:hypothetical protein